MKKLLQYIITGIVDNPEKINIAETENKNIGFSNFIVSAAPQDMGKIIGKKGKIIQAIRNLLRVKAVVLGKKANLELKEG